jgi:hypothetical protein
MKPTKSWKAVERRIARRWGTDRTPMSGGNSKHTRSDTLHKEAYIEIKHRAEFSVINLWMDTKKKADKEDKVPIVALHKKGSSFVHYLIEENDLLKVVDLFRKSQRKVLKAKSDDDT